MAQPGDGSSEEVPVQPGLPAQESKFADQGIREALIRGQFRKAWNSKAGQTLSHLSCHGLRKLSLAAVQDRPLGIGI